MRRTFRSGWDQGNAREPAGVIQEKKAGSAFCLACFPIVAKKIAGPAEKKAAGLRGYRHEGFSPNDAPFTPVRSPLAAPAGSSAVGACNRRSRKSHPPRLPSREKFPLAAGSGRQRVPGAPPPAAAGGDPAPPSRAANPPPAPAAPSIPGPESPPPRPRRLAAQGGLLRCATGHPLRPPIAGKSSGRCAGTRPCGTRVRKAGRPRLPAAVSYPWAGRPSGWGPLAPLQTKPSGVSCFCSSIPVGAASQG